jgi:ABC-type antimicrobial peptide transport system permease subunit
LDRGAIGRPSGPPVFFSGAVVLASLVLVAAWFPARRAATIDPIAALRLE